MKCKHADTTGWTWQRRGWFCSFDPALDDSRTCNDCGHWLSLGPSNDTDPRVTIEINAASLANDYAIDPPDYDSFEYCPATKSDELCAICEARWLARCIVATHEAGE